MSSAPIVYYISAHGYGHGVRSRDILRALRKLRPDVPLVAVTGLPENFLFDGLAPNGISFRQASFDVGMVQKDSIRVDVPATLRAVGSLYERRAALRDAEQRFLKDRGAGAVVADIPAIPMEASAELGLPTLAVGNFTWNWIYTPFIDQDPAWGPLIDQIAEGYARADLLLRLPFAEPMNAFDCQEDLALLAEPGDNRREELARATGADPDRTWVLLSFTALDWDEHARGRVSGIPDCEFFCMEPLGWPGTRIHSLTREGMRFTDVLATCDMVVSKPGFGIVSECIAAQKPLVYTDREDFLEYPILVEAIERYVPHAFLPSARLYRGELEQALAAAREAPPTSHRMPRGGAEQAARRILDFYGAR